MPAFGEEIEVESPTRPDSAKSQPATEDLVYECRIFAAAASIPNLLEARDKNLRCASGAWSHVLQVEEVTASLRRQQRLPQPASKGCVGRVVSCRDSAGVGRIAAALEVRAQCTVAQSPQQKRVSWRSVQVDIAAALAQYDMLTQELAPVLKVSCSFGSHGRLPEIQWSRRQDKRGEMSTPAAGQRFSKSSPSEGLA